MRYAHPTQTHQSSAMKKVEKHNSERQQRPLSPPFRNPATDARWKNCLTRLWELIGPWSYSLNADVGPYSPC